MANRYPPEYVEDALISECELVLDEMKENTVERIRDTVFQAHATSSKPGGSDIEKWFKKVAQGPNAHRVSIRGNRLNSRLIAWKTGRTLKPGNLFFRTVDTTRLLPSDLADIRIQWYAHKSLWQRLDHAEKHDPTKSRADWQIACLCNIMTDIFILRNMHDYGGADVPVVVTDWNSEQLEAALEYWASLSKGKWSQEEQREKFYEINDNKITTSARPCFLQADLLVRSLLSDPAVGYVPRFIVFLSTSSDHSVKARALFSDPAFQPPSALTDSYPTGCDAPACTKPDCAMFSHAASRSLASGSDMVRTDNFPRVGTVRCNLWPCAALEQPGERIFNKCGKCKEVLYCFKEHQQIDWTVHKLVCERHI